MEFTREQHRLLVNALDALRVNKTYTVGSDRRLLAIGPELAAELDKVRELRDRLIADGATDDCPYCAPDEACGLHGVRGLDTKRVEPGDTRAIVPGATILHAEGGETGCEAWHMFVDDGPTLTAWCDEDGEWNASILTNRMPEKYHAANGEPIMKVDVNQGDVYPTRPGAAPPGDGEYRVAWEIDLDAADPVAAARHALAIHRDPASTATVFTVTGADGTVEVDIADDPEPAPDGLRTVVFSWSTKHGDCVECGRPAAYLAPGMYGPTGEGGRLCSVCAAQAAAVDGERIVYLNAEDPDGGEPAECVAEATDDPETCPCPECVEHREIDAAQDAAGTPGRFYRLVEWSTECNVYRVEAVDKDAAIALYEEGSAELVSNSIKSSEVTLVEPEAGS